MYYPDDTGEGDGRAEESVTPILWIGARYVYLSSHGVYCGRTSSGPSRTGLL
jgi:hypothetical protein